MTPPIIQPCQPCNCIPGNEGKQTYQQNIRTTLCQMLSALNGESGIDADILDALEAGNAITAALLAIEQSANSNVFVPDAANAKNISVSASSQSVDITSTGKQVLITNTSTSSVSVKMALSSGGALTAAFTSGNGTILPAGAIALFTRPAMADRFAVIGLAANGTVQIEPGDGF